MSPEALARRREIDAKNRLNPFPVGDIPQRRGLVPYVGQRPR